MGPLLLFFVANSRPALFMPFVAPLLPAAASGAEFRLFPDAPPGSRFADARPVSTNTPASMVWSPMSNLLLYGATSRVTR